MELFTFTAYHPHTAAGRLTIPDAIKNGHTVVLVIFRNLMSGTLTANHCAHAVLAYSTAGNAILVKNSYFANKTIRIDLAMPDYQTYQRNPQQFQQSHQNFHDDDYLMWNCGRVLEFRDGLTV